MNIQLFLGLFQKRMNFSTVGWKQFFPRQILNIFMKRKGKKMNDYI